MANIDWISIKNEYVNTNISYRSLADKRGVSFATLRAKAKDGQWVELRSEQQHKTSTKLAQKTQDVIVNNEVDRISRITSVTDKLIDKLEEATEQLDQYIVTNKTKVKTTEYDTKLYKPKKEITTETEDKTIVGGIVDKNGLKQLTGALKDIRDVLASSNQADSIEEIKDNISKLTDTIVSQVAERRLEDFE